MAMVECQRCHRKVRKDDIYPTLDGKEICRGCHFGLKYNDLLDNYKALEEKVKVLDEELKTCKDKATGANVRRIELINKNNSVEPFIFTFAQAMTKVYRSHKKEKGDSWKTLPITHLEKKLKEEYLESWACPENPDELLDLSLIAMMLYLRAREDKEDEVIR